MPRGYQNYRGRRSAAVKLLIIVLVLILVSACSFIFIQRFVTYTDDGTLRLDLPPFFQELFQKPEDSQTPSTPDDANSPEDDGSALNVNLVIDEPAKEDSPVPPPAAAVERRLLQMDNLPADGSLAATLEASGANGFLWRARENTGVVRFASNVCLRDAQWKNAVPAETLTALCGVEGITSVALFNCFHDSYYAFVNMESAAICQGTGFVWYDNLNYHWLDPAKEQARNYVTNLAVECAQLGFDELLLEDMAYPASGKLQKISYAKNTTGKTEALVLFLSELRTALEPYGVRLSLLLTEDFINTGSNADSGQDLSQLLPLVDAVYAQVSDPASAQAALDAAAGDGASPVLVPLTAAPQEGQWCIAAG